MGMDGVSDTPRTDALSRHTPYDEIACTLERDLAAVTRERDEARETVDYRNALVRSLADSLKKITFMARTSGGWKPDANLIAACEQAEHVLSLPGMSKVIDERDALRAELEALQPGIDHLRETCDALERERDEARALNAESFCCGYRGGDAVTDLDELERLLREATAGPWTAQRWQDADEEIDGFSLVAARALLPLNSAVGSLEECEANAALIAALRNSAEELIRDARRHEATRYQLRVEQAKFQQAIRVLSGIHATLYPPRFTGPDGKVREFHSPLVHQQMQEISDRIRAIPDELKALDAIAQEGKG